MAKGGGTRSGLLWEVERLLDETDHLPQVLLMENVPQVHSKANMPDFEKWIGSLSGKGYANYWQDLNAKDYGVVQNRKRCFMVSILGGYNYKFPGPVPLEKAMGDYLEDRADEKYYINTEKARKLIQSLIGSGGVDAAGDYEMSGGFNQCGKVHGEGSACRTILGAHAGKACVSLTINNPGRRAAANCIMARDYGISNRKAVGNGVMEIKQVGDTMPTRARGKLDQGRVYNADGLCPGITDVGAGGGRQPVVVRCVGRNPDNPTDRTPGAPTEQRLEINSHNMCNTLTSVQKDNMVLEAGTPPRGYGKGSRSGACPDIPGHSFCGKNFTQYRIRKLTPLECWRFMGFSDSDFAKAAAVNSNTQLYKQAGNSIVKDVLMAIFGQMIGG